MGELKIISWNFAPKGWAFCNGQLLPINQNQALFSLLGTTYGGDGRVNFALPDLRDRVPMHMGQGHTLGERAGQSSHTLTLSEMPLHTHPHNANTGAGVETTPAGAVLAKAPANAYAPPANLTTLNAGTSLNIGGSQPHLNMQPYLGLYFIIALQGIFPSQN
jgi:microcystin-dependent protein